MEFSRQAYWSGLPFPSPGIFLTQGSNPHLLHWQVDSFFFLILFSKILYWFVLYCIVLVIVLYCIGRWILYHWATSEAQLNSQYLLSAHFQNSDYISLQWALFVYLLISNFQWPCELDAPFSPIVVKRKLRLREVHTLPQVTTICPRSHCGTQSCVKFAPSLPPHHLWHVVHRYKALLSSSFNRAAQGTAFLGLLSQKTRASKMYRCALHSENSRRPPACCLWLGCLIGLLILMPIY